MAHYDLYSSLSLERTLSCEEITVTLRQRLASETQRDGALREETALALAVLGGPERRRLYDRSLHDPNSSDITVAAVRGLAAMQFPTITPIPAETTTSGIQPSTVKRPPWLLPSLSAVIVIAVAAVVITWITTRPDDDINSAYGGEAAFAEQSTSNTITEPQSTYTETPTPEPDQDDNGGATDDVRTTLVGELTNTGWYGIPEASCITEDDTLVFAGGNTDGDLITICEDHANGDYYYRGYVNRKGGLSWDIDMSSYSDDRFQTKPKGGNYIEVTAGGLRVYSTDANGPVSETDFDWFDSNLNGDFS